MTHTFNGGENASEQYNWCLENIGPVGNGWTWSLNQGHACTDGTYQPTVVDIHIDDDIDATAYKLRWV